MRYCLTWKILGLCAVMVAGIGLEAPLAIAQQESPAGLSGATVALYTGDCGDPLADPRYELGVLEYRKVIDLTDTPSTVSVEEPAQDDLGRLGEDRNGNGVLDPDEDQNDNGTLDAGIDINASGTLDDDEIIPESDLMIQNIPEVWMLERAPGLDIVELLDEEYVIAVHQGVGEDRRIIACGGQGDAPESSFINLVPMGDANYRGYARLLLGEDVADKDFHVVMFETLLQGEEDQQSQEATATPTS
ncbi:MAG: hypothetical protein KY456_08605 [Chloroflexi bacterium]|nr:hypothetical protein [Chloroflexota bacterium]